MSPLPLTAFAPTPLVTACLEASAVDPALGGVVLIDPSGAEAPALLASFLAAAGVACVRLPVGIDRRALLGGVDVESSLRDGRVVLARGLIESDGAFFIENLASWSPERRALLRRAIGGSGAGARLYATWGDEEPPPMSFLDPVAFVVQLETEETTPAILRQRLRREFAAARDARLIARLDRARGLLETIDCEPAAFALAASACTAGVEGDRAVVLAVRAARAHAALRGAVAIEDEDLVFARLVVFTSRLRPQGESSSPTAPDSSRGDESTEGRGAGSEGGAPGQAGTAVDEAAMPADAPDVPVLPRVSTRRRRARHGGGEARLAAWDRGAPERVVERRPGARRVALADTLRRAAARGEGLPLRVLPEDLRFRRFHRRAGRLFVLAVDASGSMARHRIREAKGVVTELLGEAYRRRDQVAVVVARGRRAEVLVPPTASVARAKRIMSLVPVGGGTPLASALDEIVRLVERESRSSARDPVVVLLTDGRANVAAREGDVAADLEAAAMRFRGHELPCVVVDTTGPFSGRDDARRLATLLGAALHPMPPGRSAAFLVEKLNP